MVRDARSSPAETEEVVRNVAGVVAALSGLLTNTTTCDACGCLCLPVEVCPGCRSTAMLRGPQHPRRRAPRVQHPVRRSMVRTVEVPFKDRVEAALSRRYRPDCAS